MGYLPYQLLSRIGEPSTVSRLHPPMAAGIRLQSLEKLQWISIACVSAWLKDTEIRPSSVGFWGEEIGKFPDLITQDVKNYLDKL